VDQEFVSSEIEPLRDGSLFTSLGALLMLRDLRGLNVVDGDVVELARSTLDRSVLRSCAFCGLSVNPNCCCMAFTGST
jgi:hypothetical protein